MKKYNLNFNLIALSLFINQLLCIETPSGALISVDFTGIVGFNLDEIPPYSIDSTIAYIIHKITDAEWMQRAQMQIFATVNRQVFGFDRQLTLPPEQVWKIEFTSPPFLDTIQNHLHIVRTYRFHSVLVGTANSLNTSQPLLVNIGSTFGQKFIVPIDPENLFQRIELACTGASSVVDSENILTVYEESTVKSDVNCVDVLKEKIGYTSLDFIWQRLAWSQDLASQFRYGNQESEYADLEGDLSSLTDEMNIGYRFFEEDSCTLNEGGAGLNRGCIGGTGWRQLLKFTSASVNVGRTAIHLGDVQTNTYIERGVFEFDPCHEHYHFQHYANFNFGKVPARKTGFCLESTWRYHNNEWTDFNTPYSMCNYQGISVGWGDEYFAGLECQWIDVTGIKPDNYKLEVILNPDDFICEGLSLKDPVSQNQEWIETEFKSSSNQTVYREACNFTENHQINNDLQTMVNFAGKNSIVTLPCKRKGIISPTKDCGFDIQYDNLKCEINQVMNSILVENIGETQAIVRLCETSHVLGHSIACEYNNKLANVQLGPNSQMEISFMCPQKRSDKEPGGLYSVLVASLLPNEIIPKVNIYFQ